MSQTLGEKLRHAREERGISIAEVAEQTRISPYYIESIERDDYKPLPGGIFNKGFVKSYAKYVDIDEQQALADYTSLISAAQPVNEPEPRAYRPEVLTDDRSGRSMTPTIIMAVVILALMTGGILFGLNYLQNRGATEPGNAAANSNANASLQFNANSGPAAASAPDMSTLRIDFKAVGSDISISAIKDSAKPVTTLVKGGDTISFDPKESLKISYSRSLASAAQLAINGKAITPPAQPLAKRNIIEFEINKSNLAQIWQSGAISPDSAPQMPTAGPVPGSTTPGIKAPASPRPTNTLANTAGSNTAKAANKPISALKPAATPAAAVTKPKTQ
jgi:cytoskeleton protein RodZ